MWAALGCNTSTGGLLDPLDVASILRKAASNSTATIQKQFPTAMKQQKTAKDHHHLAFSSTISSSGHFPLPQHARVLLQGL
jgi:hypothetical protein